MLVQDQVSKLLQPFSYLKEKEKKIILKHKNKIYWM